MPIMHRWAKAVQTVTLLCIALLAASPVVQAQTFDVPEAKAAKLIVVETGQVLYAKEADVPLPPASLVKMMTMLLTLEAIERGEVRYDELVRTSRNAASVSGSKVWLAEGDRLTVEQLLWAVAIQSANDASIVLAERVAGSEVAFVNRMNERARSLGMTNTHFSNAHGLPDVILVEGGPPKMSATDALILGRELVRKFPIVLEWTSQWNKPLGPGTRNPIVLENTNRLVLTSSLPIDGLKTGHTSEAGYLLVATAEIDGLRLMSAVMGAATSEARNTATERLLSYGFNAFDRVLIGDDETFRVAVPDAVGEHPVRPEKPFTVLIPKTQVAQVRTEVVLDEGVRAPVASGERIGEIVVTINGEEAVRVPAYSVQDVSRAGFFRRTWAQFTRWLSDLFRGGN